MTDTPPTLSMDAGSAASLAIRPEGLYCPQGDFFIDPMQPVARALVTHGHADHARAGHGAVMATRQTLAIMAVRYGEDFAGTRQIAACGERLRVGAVDVSFHPAGHVLGSAQILIEQGGHRTVISGDYKRASDPTCLPFEPVRCHAFITEATFGLPIFHHPPALNEIARLLESCRAFPERAHLIGAYSLGKAQRVIALARQAGWDRPIWLHGAVKKLTDFYVSEGIELGEIRLVSEAKRADLGGQVVVCPPSATRDLWARAFPDPVVANASGWMRTRARARQSGVQLPLVISDHADWSELCATVSETGCETLWVTHGAEEALVYWAGSRGIDASALHLMGYDSGEEMLEAPAP